MRIGCSTSLVRSTESEALANNGPELPVFAETPKNSTSEITRAEMHFARSNVRQNRTNGDSKRNGFRVDESILDNKPSR